MSSFNEIFERFEASDTEINHAGEFIKTIRNKMYDFAYAKGMEDAWEMVKKILFLPSEGGLTFSELENIFGTFSAYRILENNSAIMVKEKIDDYIKKEKEALHIGDEIKYGDTGRKYVVTWIYPYPDENNNINVRAIDYRGESYTFASKRIKKTGRHFDEAEKLFERMEEGSKP